MGGSAAYDRRGVEECAGGAKVSLFQGDRLLGTTIADRFGDFKFDGLEKNSGGYRLEIKFRDLKAKVVEAELETSLNLGMIKL